MPHLALEVPETYDNISRPVATGIVRDLINRLELPNDTGILYSGNAEGVAHNGSVLAQKHEMVKFPFTGRVKVDMEESYVEDRTLSTAVKKLDNIPIFADNTLQTYLSPVYTTTQMVINFRYRAPDRGTALRWRDQFRRKASEGRETLLHEVDYHYAIPPAYEVILKEIYRLREAVEGYGDTLDKWFAEHFASTMTQLTTLGGTESILAIAERQIGIQGWFDFVAEPDAPEKTREGESWEVGFSYTLQYDKVTAVTMKYPIVVHNQLLSDRYVSTEPLYDLYTRPRRPSWSGQLSELFSPHARRPYPRIEGIRLPDYDDWTPITSAFRTLDVLTALVGVELSDPTRIVNLTELGDFSLAEDIVGFLKSEHTYLTRYLHSAFHVTFFVGDSPRSENSFYVDEELTVRSKSPLNPRQVHHVRISVVSNLRSLTPRAEEALRSAPPIVTKVVDFVEDSYRPILSIADGGSGGLEVGNYNGPRGGYTGGPGHRTKSRDRLSSDLVIIGGRVVTKDSFNRVIGRLPTHPDLTSMNGGKGMKSVMRTGIIAHKG